MARITRGFAGGALREGTIYVALPEAVLAVLSVDGDNAIFDGQTGIIILPTNGLFAGSGNRVTIDQGGVRRNQVVTAESPDSITITADLTGFTMPGTAILSVHKPK